MAVPLSASTRNTVIAGLAATAVGVSALVGIQAAASASLTDAPVINEFVTDTAGTDVLEFAEILVPENFDTAELHVVGIEGDGNSNQGKAVHVYPLADVEFDDDGRGVLTVPVNGFQNGSLTLALVNGAVARNTQMDAELDGVLDDAALADQGVEVLDVVGLHDGDSGDLAWGTELSASDFDGYTGTLGGASRVPDGSDTWVPNAYNGAGLPGIDAAPRGEFEVASTPGTANGEGAGTPEPEPTDEATDEPTTEPTDEPSEPGAVCDADVTPISEVQGAGAATPLNGQNVTVRGVVVGDFFNASGGSNGFWVQERDETADDDLATSEAVFVHHPNAEAPEQGTLVTVSGRAGEYDNQTQLANTTVTECGTAELPAPVEISFPVEEDYEHLEGMRVMIPEAIVLETYQFGRYGEIVVGPERQFTPTAIHAPESAEAQELYESNQANRITIDDRNSLQNYYPAEHLNGEPFSSENYFRGGDTFRDLTGVMDFRNSVWKIQRTEAADYENTVPRESEVPDVGGDVQVAAFNVLNYFTTFNSRGAQDDEEFERQKAKLVAAIGDLGSDVVGLMEIENNNDVALRDLVDGVNNYLGEDRYVALDTGRLGTDQITTAMMYDPEAVTPAGAHQVLDGSVDSRFNTSGHRPALAQTFTAAGETGELGEFTVITNHLKSKGSECGSEDNNTHLVGSCDAERTAAAEALVDWAVDAELPKPVIMGDLNAYDHEAPITTLTEGGYVDLKKEYEGEEAYSYVFDGQLGYLDYAMAHEDIMPYISGAASWHTNSDEISVLDYQTRFHTDPRQDDIYAPDVYRSSDHDPVVFGLNLDESGTEPGEPGEPGDGDIPVEAEIPGLPGDDDDNNAPGSLVLSIADGTATLGNQRNAGDRLRVTGELPAVSVTDTRRDGAGWAVAGQSSDLSIAGDSGESVTADHLGWAPFVTDTTNSATPGEVSRGVLAGGEGLAAPATLGSATEETRLGTSDLAADLVLEVPVDTEAGTYTGALSVSLFPVD